MTTISFQTLCEKMKSDKKRKLCKISIIYKIYSPPQTKNTSHKRKEESICIEKLLVCYTAGEIISGNTKF